MLAAIRGGFLTDNIFVDIVIIAACIALVWIALKKFKVQIPEWAIQVFWVVIVAVVVIFAIRFVMTL